MDQLGEGVREKAGRALDFAGRQLRHLSESDLDALAKVLDDG